MVHKPLHIGRASELSGKDRVIYRAFEILPGFLSWGTILGSIIFSYFAPVYVTLFIIAFDFYWLLKTAYLSIHLRQNWKRMKHNMNLDWQKMLVAIRYEHLIHLIILPFYNEDEEVVEKSIEALSHSNYDKKKIFVALATEDRAGESAQIIAKKMQAKFGHIFGSFHITVHPKDTPGEMPGKGSNISYSAEAIRKEVLDVKKIPYENVLVSAFDIDTVAYPDYLNCLTWHFCTAEKPLQSSYQPVPLYNNNIWDAPALSRVVASSGTFWQMIQQERPEKLATFSSHAINFQTLYRIGYWQRNMVSEDSRIFWNALMAHDGHYEVVPISYPVSMDANLAPTFWKTIKNIYKQQRRWAWGVENVPYILFNFVKNKEISVWRKIRVSFTQLEGFWSLATNPILIFILGWMPLILGGDAFRSTVLSYNLPIFTRNIMIVAMTGLIISGIISLRMLPKAPKNTSSLKKATMLLQWILIPFTITIFGAIPGLDAQTRLLFGKYMGFWVTPKHRSSHAKISS